MSTPLSEITHSLSQIGLAANSGKLVALAGVSAVVGRSYSIQHPLTRTPVTAAMNLLLVAEPGRHARTGITLVMRTFTDLLTARIMAARRQGEKQLLKERIAVEKEAEILLDHIRNPPLQDQAPLTIPIPQEIRIEEARKKAVADAEVVSARLCEIYCEQQPQLLVDGLDRQRMKRLDLGSFDAAVCNYSPQGYALRRLRGSGPVERREIARFINSAWQGQLFATGVDTLLQPQVTNIWLNSVREIRQALDDSILSEEGMFSTFHIISVPPAPVSQAPDPAPLWEELVTRLWKTRLRRPQTRLHLAPEAIPVFIDLTNLPGNAESHTPEKILKLALLHHLAIGNTSDPVSLESLEIARELAGMSFDIEAEIPPEPGDNPLLTQMLDKLRRHGPLRKWVLFKKFHRHSSRRLDPPLNELVHRGLVQVDDGVITVVPETETNDHVQHSALNRRAARPEML